MSAAPPRHGSRIRGRDGTRFALEFYRLRLSRTAIVEAIAFEIYVAAMLLYCYSSATVSHLVRAQRVATFNICDSS